MSALRVTSLAILLNAHAELVLLAVWTKIMPCWRPRFVPIMSSLPIKALISHGQARGLFNFHFQANKYPWFLQLSVATYWHLCFLSQVTRQSWQTSGLNDIQNDYSMPLVAQPTEAWNTSFWWSTDLIWKASWLNDSKCFPVHTTIFEFKNSTVMQHYTQ